MNEGDNAATITTSRPEHRPRAYTVNIHRTSRVHPTVWSIEILSEPAPGSNDTYGVGHQIALDHGYNEIRITAVKPARYRTTHVVAAFYPITPHIDSVEIISDPGPFLSYAPGDYIEIAVNSSSIHRASVRNAEDTADASVDHRAVPHQADHRVNAP